MVIRLPPGTSIFAVMAASIAIERDVEIVSAFWSMDKHWVMEAGLVVAYILAASLILFFRNPRYFLNLFRGKLLNPFLKLFKTKAPLLYKLFIIEPFMNDYVQHP